MSPRVQILFFDMNSFYASVAQAEEPALMGRPVGVLTTDAPNAACIAASIDAKRAGVGMGTRQDEARKLCPGIVFRAVKLGVTPAIVPLGVSYGPDPVPRDSREATTGASCYFGTPVTDLPGKPAEIARLVREVLQDAVDGAVKAY